MNRLTLTRRVQSQRVTPSSDIVDVFSRVNNSTSLGSTPSGYAWAAGGAGTSTSWGISLNKAKCNSTSGEGVAAVSTSLADGFVEADITLSPVRSSVGLIFRGASIATAVIGGNDSINRLLVRLRKQAASDTIDLYHRGTANYALLAQKTPAGLVLGTTYRLKATFSGTAIEVFLDGVSQFTYNTTTGKESQTQHGLCMFVGASDDDGQSRIDNLRIGA